MQLSPSSSRERIRVVYLAGQLGLGGSEQQLYYVLSNIDRSRFCLNVITLGPAAEYWEQPISELGIQVLHVPRGATRPTRAIQVAHLLRLLRPDIVHSWSYHANPYAAIGARLARVAVRVGSLRGAVDQTMLRWVGSWGLDAIVTNSLAVTPRHLLGARLRMIPNGVLIPGPIADAERRHLRTELGVRDNRFVIGTIGRMDANKNHAMLLKAFAELARRYPHVYLVILGDGPLRAHIATLAGRLGISSRVSLPGVVSAAARYLPAFDVFCLTSHSEGMPNALMEAAAAGVPIVSTDWADCHVLVEDKVTGWLVPRNDYGTLSTALDDLLAQQELRISLGQAARTKMRRGFSVEAMVSRFVDLYDEVTHSKQAPTGSRRDGIRA